MPPAKRLSYYDQVWELDREQCPCDLHFLEYLKANDIQGKVIFHFGTGGHHIVGRTNARLHRPNHILAVTASPGEYRRYIDLIIRRPAIAVWYKVIFTDIYTLSPRILPRFDVVTLFHLGEFPSGADSGYAPLDDRGLLDLFIGRMKPGGRICFYNKSWKYFRARPVIDAAVAYGKLAWVGRSRTLSIYERPEQDP